MYLKCCFAETYVQRRRRDLSVMAATSCRNTIEGLSLQHNEPRRILGRTRQKVECRGDWTVRLPVSAPITLSSR